MAKVMNVVVVGAGYAGLLAANRLQASLTLDAESRAVEVVVVNPTGDFVDRIRLHQVAAGTTPNAVRPLNQLLHPAVKTVLGTVSQIEPAINTLRLNTPDGPQRLKYDILIYAAGSGCTPGNVAGTDVIQVGTLAGATRINATLRELPEGSDIHVVGGGATGVEVAAEIGEAFPQHSVRILTAGTLLKTWPPRAQRYVTRTLTKLNVSALEGARVVSVMDKTILLDDGERLNSDLTISAASFGVPALAADSGLPVDPQGRLVVTESLQVSSYPNIIGAGDAIKIDGPAGSHLRMGCAVASHIGGHAAETALNLIRCQTPVPLSVGFFIRCLSLGRRSGYIQHVTPDDLPRRMWISGPLGAWVKERICVGVISGIEKERTKPGSYFSPSGPRPSVQRDGRRDRRSSVRPDNKPVDGLDTSIGSR